MSKSTDAELYFQTDSSISEVNRKAAKSKNDFGHPIRLGSKILAMIADPYDDGAVYVAEAAGTIRRVVLETAEISPPLCPPTANRTPLTCLAVTSTASQPPQHTLWAGAWDKAIYGFALAAPPPTAADATAAKPRPLPPLRGAHTDFVKAVLALRPATATAPALLLSAGAEGNLALWDAAAGALLRLVRRAHARPVLALALARDDEGPGHGVVVVSADSNRELRAWRVGAAAGTVREVPLVGTLAPRDGEHGEGGGGGGAEGDGGSDQGASSASAIAPLVVHETSVFALAVAPDSGDLWTASADKTAKGLSCAAGFAVDAVLQHPDHVKSIAVCPRLGLVVTGCRDEGVRAWDSATGELVAELLRGHWEEVTSVLVLGRYIVSTGIDGTVRRWGLGRDQLVDEMKRMNSATVEEVEEAHEVKKPSLLTEEEERELEDLMDSD